MVTTEPAVSSARLLDLNYILVTCRACSTKSYFAESFSSIFFLTLRAEPPSVFLSEEEKRRLCLNRAKPLNSPQPKFLDYSVLFSLVKPVLFECEHPFFDKPMVLTDPAEATCRACSTKILLDSCRVSL